MATTQQPLHFSKNRLEGSLCDSPISRILEECFHHQVTGMLRISACGRQGTIELRAGAVDRVEFSGLSGSRALDVLDRLRVGSYELVQRLPDLGGALGKAAQFEGRTDELSVVALMRYCEDNALSCTITLIDDFNRAEIVYRSGEILVIRFNGEEDEDRILDVLRFERARFRVSAPPLDLEIEGWPACGREPTAPFRIGDEAARIRAAGDADRSPHASEDEDAHADADVYESVCVQAPEEPPACREEPEPLVIPRGSRRAVPLVVAGALLMAGLWVYLVSQALA